MDLEAMRRLTQNMQEVNEGSASSSGEEGNNLFSLANACEEKDPQKAFELYKQAANLGNVDAMFCTGVYYYFGGMTLVTPQDLPQAFAWFKKAAENGHVNAMLWTGELYRDGEGVVQNIREAIQWFEKSSEGGNSWAALDLGRIYRDGTGVKQDFVKALLWFNKCAESDDNFVAPIALIELGDMHRDGIGVNENLDKAVEYYNEAAELGSSDALVRLADIFNHGKEHEEEAFKLYKQAAELGNSYGFHGLGRMYYFGWYVEKNYSEAFELFDKAVELDGTNCKALKCLADCYRWGDGVQKDCSKAYELYTQAADLGDGEAMYKISQMHELGVGVEQDLNVAEELANRARAMGYTPQEDEGTCFITTAVCKSLGKPDDCYELKTFRKFRDDWLINQLDGKSLIGEYYSIAPQIVEKINRLPYAAQVYEELLKNYLEPCLKLIEQGDNQACKQLYINMITSLKKKFLSD